MNDYLRNLAARNVNLADVIQPRLASRFEPTPVHGALGLRTDVPSFTDEHEMTELAAQASIRPRQAQRAEPQAAATDEHAVRRSLLAQAQPLSPTVQEASIIPVPAQDKAEAQSETMLEPQPLSRPAPRAVPSVAPTVMAQPQAPPLLRSDTQPQTPLDQTSVRPGVHLPALDVVSQSAAPKRQPMLQPIIASIIEHEVIERQTAQPAQPRQQQPSIERRTVQPAQVREQQPSIERQTVQPAQPRQQQPSIEWRTAQPAQVREQQPSSSDAPQAVVVQPRVMRIEHRGEDRSNSSPLAMSAQVPPPAPTIHVTIGRIEVRATVPAMPASKPRPAPQTMSLDDYLCQRSRGGKL